MSTTTVEVTAEQCRCNDETARVQLVADVSTPIGEGGVRDDQAAGMHDGAQIVEEVAVLIDHLAVKAENGTEMLPAPV
ncbi:hypothetical protein [Micrococcus luteus]|uniref:hypothetical protein n=1 Tax=Micrococcus luteus TaxID=1270 RepID=UPI001E46A569|nr:hypothetical protein [Micrococcus luteus]MCD0181103.1 hypothetical protein [Micrococcus luteus]